MKNKRLDKIASCLKSIPYNARKITLGPCSPLPSVFSVELRHLCHLLCSLLSNQGDSVDEVAADRYPYFTHFNYSFKH